MPPPPKKLIPIPKSCCKNINNKPLNASLFVTNFILCENIGRFYFREARFPGIRNTGVAAGRILEFSTTPQLLTLGL
jgi:hypothetical protein